MLFSPAYFDLNSKIIGQKEVWTHEFWFAFWEYFHAYFLRDGPEDAIA